MLEPQSPSVRGCSPACPSARKRSRFYLVGSDRLGVDLLRPGGHFPTVERERFLVRACRAAAPDTAHRKRPPKKAPHLYICNMQAS
ncbi:unnamed protein product [Boreogadus saida]